MENISIIKGIEVNVKKKGLLTFDVLTALIH
jgi:hypothetical protein